MGKFKFRLETLLRIREQHRDEKQNELNEALSALRILESHQQHVADELSNVLDQTRQAIGGGEVIVNHVLNLRRYETTLLERQTEMKGQHEQVTAESERRREILVEANRQVKILEKLREKQEERHRETERMVEVNQLDEVAGTRFGRGYEI